MYGQKQPSGLDELKKRLKEGRTSGAFLLWGEEEYTKDHYAERLRKLGTGAPLPDFNYMLFDAEKQTPGELEEATFALPYLWDKRVIELRGLRPSSVSAEDGEYYARILASLPDYLTVFLLLRAGEGGKEKKTDGKRADGFRMITEAIEAHGLSVEFAPERGAKLCNWVAKHFSARNVRTTPQLPQALIDYCGTDMYTLQGEIEKLCSAYEGNVLTEQDMIRYCCPNEKSVFFDVTDCMNRGDVAGARRILSNLRMDRDAVQMAIGNLASNYQLMLLVKAGQECGKSAQQIASEHKLWNSQVNRAIASLSRTEPAVLRYAVAAITEADQTIKRMRADPKAVLELLIYKICAYRNHVR